MYATLLIIANQLNMPSVVKSQRHQEEMKSVQNTTNKSNRKKKEHIPLIKTILKKPSATNKSRNRKMQQLFKQNSNRRLEGELLDDETVLQEGATSLQEEETSVLEEDNGLQEEDYCGLARNSLLPAYLYGKLVKKPPQTDQLVRPGDRRDADSTWAVFEEILSDASDKMSLTSRTSNVPFVKKTGQQDGPFDLEPLVTHIGQIIDAGKFDKFSPPGGSVAHRKKLNHAMGFFRKARISFTKFRYVDLMVNCDIYVSAVMQVSGQGMLRAPLIEAKCRKYLDAACLRVVDPLPP